MELIETIEKKTEWIFSKPIIGIIIICFVSIGLRVYFTPWSSLSNSPDAVFYLINALALSEFGYSYFHIGFLWPLILSIFFSMFDFQNNLEYVNLMRIISMAISIVTIPIIFLVAQKYVKTKFALLISAFFAFEPNLIENSIFAITEPLFILLGMITFYFILQKNIKFYLLAFVFAGLSFDTRINGIMLLLFLVGVSIIRIKERRVMLQIILVGITIFVAVGFVHISIPLEHNQIPYLYHFEKVFGIINGEEVFSSTYDPTKTPDGASIIKNSLLNTFLYIFRISIPYLILFVPIGLIISFRNINFEKKVLYLAIILTIIIAIPQNTMSNEYRNLFFLIPFFCILSGIGIQKITENFKLKNILLVLLIGGLIILSYNFLRERYDTDQEIIEQKNNFGKYITKNFNGNFTGGEFVWIVQNMQDVKYVSLEKAKFYFNDNFGFLWAINRVYSDVDTLMEDMKKEDIDYLIITKEQDKRFPIFSKIYNNESEFSFLTKIIDTKKTKEFEKINTKIFKINYDKLE